MKFMALAFVVLSAAPALAQHDPPARDGEKPAAAKAPEGFEHVLSPDALGFLGVADVDALLRDMRASAAGQWWLDPVNAPVRQAVAGQVAEFGKQGMERLGVNPLDLLGMVHGRAALALLGTLKADPEGSDRPIGLSLALLADTGADHEAAEAIVTTMLGQMAVHDNAVRKTETVGDTEVSVFELKDPGAEPGDAATVRLHFAFHGETLVVVMDYLPVGHDVTELVLARLDGEPGDTLAAAPRFRDSLASHAGGLQFWVDAGAFANFGKSVLEGERDAAAELGDEPADEDDESGDESGGLDDYYAGLIETQQNLGLYDIGCISGTSAWSEHGSRSQLRVDWPGEGWIPTFARLALGGGGESLFAAVPAGCLSAISANADFGAIFDEALKALIRSGAIPPSAAADFLAQAEESLGFNPRDDLLDALDGRLTVVTCRVPPEDRFPMSEGEPQNIVMLLGLKDGARVNTLIESLITKSGLNAARKRLEFQGFELFNVPLGPGIAVNYAVLPDMAVISTSATLVQDVLRRKAGGADLPVLAADADWKACRALLAGPTGLVGYGKADEGAKSFAKLIDTVRELVRDQAPSARPDNPEGSFAAFLVALPPLDTATIERHFKGATASSVAADAGGFLLQEAGP